ncbi:MAG: glycosyltransferase family 2 protein [Bdellovibrionota bacterium]
MSDVAVVIPVKNGGAVFRKVVEAVLTQEPAPGTLVCVDSGSTDGTVEFLRETRDRLARAKSTQLKLLEISPNEFGHGKTRNLGVASCSEEFVAILTHDAHPVGRNWLQELVRPLREKSEVGGVFGRHIPYPETRTVEQLKVHAGFERYDLPEPVWKISSPGDPGFLFFYSDNNSALRRRTWLKTPYPDVTMGEDQLWAKAMMEAGWAKAFARNAVVMHSHDFTLRETWHRQYDEMSVHIGILGLGALRNKPLLRYVLGEIRRDLRVCLKAPRGRFLPLLAAQIPYTLASAWAKWARVRAESRKKF